LLLTATVVAAALRFYLRYRRHQPSPLNGVTFRPPVEMCETCQPA